MKQSTLRSLLATAALLPTIFAQIVPLMPGMGMDPMDPMCVDDGVQTIIYEYPVFYSTVYESVGTIFSFLGGTNSLVINNPGQTIVTSTVLTTTVVSTSTTTATVTASGGSGSGKVFTATLGAGIPSGTVQSIPSNFPFALAFVLGATGGTPDGYAAGGELGDVTDANYFYLEAGELPSTNGGKVGRNYTQSVRRRQDTSSTVAKIEASIYYNDITTDFFLVDGVLNWVSPDLGAATFYACPDGLYAGFPDAPGGTCDQALVGAVAKTAVDQQLATDNSTSSGDGSDTTTDGSSPSTTDSGAAATSDSGAAATTDSGAAATTDSEAAATSAAAGDESPCPGQDPSDDYFGYSVYCGQAVDPVNPDGDLIPDGQMGVTSFDDCTILCDSTDGCTGLSYYAPDSTCYIHSGESQDPVAAPGYDSAIKNNNNSGDDSGDSSSTTSTMSQDSSTTDGDGAAMTSNSGMSASGSAESTPTSSSMSSGMISNPSASATGSVGSSATSSSMSSPMASSSSASGTGSMGSSGTSSAMSSSMTLGSATSSSGSTASAGTSSMMPSSASPSSAASSMGGTVSNGSSSTMSSAMSSSMTSNSAMSESMGTSSTTSKSPYSNATSSSVAGGTTTPASSTMSSIMTTTSSSPSSTISTDVCPTPSGSVVGAYSIYCEYVVDPVSSTDSFPLINPISFQGCLNACTANSTCVGLSYIESSTTCYLHGGQNQAPAARSGWRGAIKVGTGGPNSTTTTTTTITTSASSTMTSISTSSSSTSSVSTSSGSTSSASSSTASSLSTSTPVLTTPGVTTPNLLGTTSSTSSSTSSGSSSGSSSTTTSLSNQSTTTTSTSSTSSSSSSSTTTPAVVVTTPGVTTPNVLPITTSSTSTSTSSTTMVTPNVSTSTSSTSTTTTTTTTTTTSSSAAATTTTAVGAQNNPKSASYSYCQANCPSSASQVQNGYRVYQDTTWGGASFANSQVTSFTACLNYCSSTSDSSGLPCVGANYNSASGYCYLHNDCHNAQTESSSSSYESGEMVSSSCAAVN